MDVVSYPSTRSDDMGCTDHQTGGVETLNFGDYNPPSLFSCSSGQIEDKSGNCVDKPCQGNRLKKMEITPQLLSGTNGGRFGCTRNGTTCDGISNKKKRNRIDLKNPYRAPILAIYGGLVYQTYSDDDGLGYWINIQFNLNGTTYIASYAHFKDNNWPYEAGDIVPTGAIIGYQGDSGNLKSAIDQDLTVSHVHIQLKKHYCSSGRNYDTNFTTVDPEILLNATFDQNGNTISNCQ